jgi:hypothetical protein
VLALTMMTARPGWLRAGRWLAVAGLLACRPAAVNEAARRVHPAANSVPARAVDRAPAPAIVAAAKPPLPAATPVIPETDAASLLAAGQAEAALAALALEPAAAAGEPRWFVQGMLRARAERSAGRPGLASAGLAELLASRTMPPGLPRELLIDEYARSLMAEAAGLAPREADALRRRAAEQWRKALKLEPVRNLAVMRVAHAEALAAVEGEGAGRRAAASQAVKALNEVLRAYPEHPRAGALELARAQALQRAGKSREAIAALRRLAIERTGTTEAEAAEAALTGLGKPPRWSALELVDRANAARRIRRYDVSRALLDELLRDPETPAHVRPIARRARAYTASKQRDFAQSAADLELLYGVSPSGDLRDDMLRAFDRAGRYDDALAILTKQAERKGGARPRCRRRSSRRCAAVDMRRPSRCSSACPPRTDCAAIGRGWRRGSSSGSASARRRSPGSLRSRRSCAPSRRWSPGISAVDCCSPHRRTAPRVSRCCAP